MNVKRGSIEEKQSNAVTQQSSNGPSDEILVSDSKGATWEGLANEAAEQGRSATDKY